MAFDVSALPARYQQQIREGLSKKKAPAPAAPPAPPVKEEEVPLDLGPVTQPRTERHSDCLIIWIEMMGKPRMTQRDKWKKRDRVVRYRHLADRLRLAVPPDMLEGVLGVSWVCYLPMADSWPKWKKQRFAGKLHQDKPDSDNIRKALQDILFKEDSWLAFGADVKYWDDGLGSRIILKFHYEHPDYAGEHPADSRRGSKGR